jgi:hypothetical protein
MSFQLSEVVAAAAPSVFSMLADVKQLFHCASAPSSQDSSQDSSTCPRRVYLRSEVSLKCTVADAASNVVQHELEDGFHVARYTWEIHPLPGGNVRVELRVRRRCSAGLRSAPPQGAHARPSRSASARPPPSPAPAPQAHCYVEQGGVVSPSEQLAAMLRRDEVRTLRCLKQRAEREAAAGGGGGGGANHSAAHQLLAW